MDARLPLLCTQPRLRAVLGVQGARCAVRSAPQPSLRKHDGSKESSQQIFFLDVDESGVAVEGELPMAASPVVGPHGRFSSLVLPSKPLAKADVSISRCSIVEGVVDVNSSIRFNIFLKERGTHHCPVPGMAKLQRQRHAH